MMQAHKNTKKGNGSADISVREPPKGTPLIPQRVVPLSEDLLKSIATELGASSGACVVEALKQIETNAAARIALSETTISQRIHTLSREMGALNLIVSEAKRAAGAASDSAEAAARAVGTANKTTEAIPDLVNQAVASALTAEVQRSTAAGFESVKLSGPSLIAHLVTTLSQLDGLYTTVKDNTAPDLVGLISNVSNIVMEKLDPVLKQAQATQAESKALLEQALATVTDLKKTQAAVSKMFAALQAALGNDLASASYLQGMLLADATPAIVNVLRQKDDEWKAQIPQLVELVGKDNLRAVLSDLADKPHVLIAALASEDGMSTAEVESGCKEEMDMIQTRAAACFKALSPKESV